MISLRSTSATGTTTTGPGAGSADRERFVSTTFPSLGTTATVVTVGAGGHDAAVDAVRAELASMDEAASRFRDDSEISRVNRAAGRPVAVSEAFLEALDAALRAARITDGLVDPTIGRALRLLGYDRDFAAMDLDGGPAVTVLAQSVPGWAAVTVDRVAGTVTVPAGVELDFGATAKALCADRAARRAFAALSAGPALTRDAALSTGTAPTPDTATLTGVLVSLGGDMAVAGPAPAGGWPVGISADHADPLDPHGPSVAISTGGLATSSTSVRRWRRGGEELHHIVDPRTGRSAAPTWAAVSVAAGSCLDANIASCAAILLGPAAPEWLEQRSMPARLVDHRGGARTVAGWPGSETDSSLRRPPQPAGSAR